MKFKNAGRKPQKKTSNRKFPINYRRIPEKLNSDEAVFFTGVFSILICILIISADLYSNFYKEKTLTYEKLKIVSEIAFWENELKTKPNYRDGYFRLALLEYQLKNFDNANKDLGRVFEIDPSFEKGRELEKLLRNF